MKKMLFLTVMVIFLPVSAMAMKVSNLYQADFTVNSKTAEERGQVVPIGLRSILTKLTGDDSLMTPDIKDSMNRAEYFVSKYRYFLPTPDSSQYRIQINYEPADVNRLLQRADIPYWGDERPLILVWLIVNDKQHVGEIIGSEAADELFSLVKRKGSKYGLPIIFPMMDVVDMHEVMPADVANMNVTTLRKAGDRYVANVLLIGKLDFVNNAYQSAWELVTDKQLWRWGVDDKTADELFDTVMGQVVQTFAKNEAAKPTAVVQVKPVTMQLEVYNINTPEEQAKLATYLGQMAVVQSVKVDEVVGDAVDLSLTLKGTVSQFHQMAETDKQMVFKSKDESGMFIYVWVN